MTKAEYDNLREQLRQRFRDDMQALHRVFRISQRVAEENHREDEPEPLGDNPQIHEQLVAAVREAVSGLETDFGSKQVKILIRKRHPEFASVDRATIATTLRRLIKTNDVVLVKAGKGNVPSIFRTYRAKPEGGSS